MFPKSSVPQSSNDMWSECVFLPFSQSSSHILSDLAFLLFPQSSNDLWSDLVFLPLPQSSNAAILRPGITHLPRPHVTFMTARISSSAPPAHCLPTLLTEGLVWGSFKSLSHSLGPSSYLRLALPCLRWGLTMAAHQALGVVH